MHRRVQQEERRGNDQEHFRDPSMVLRTTKAMLEQIVQDVSGRLNVVAFEETIVLARLHDDQCVQCDDGEKRNDEGEKEIDDVHLTCESKPLSQSDALGFIQGQCCSFGTGQFNA